jgi:hypothetical protein
MQSTTTLLLSALLGSIGLMGVPTSASATVTTQPGTSCKAYGNSKGLKNYLQGINNPTATAQGVVCPVTRTALPTGTNWPVYVDGNFGAGVGYCTLYSYDFTGGYLGSYTVSGITGVFDKLLILPATQVTPYSYQSVYCNVPAGGYVYDVEPVY